MYNCNPLPLMSFLKYFWIPQLVTVNLVHFKFLVQFIMSFIRA